MKWAGYTIMFLVLLLALDINKIFIEKVSGVLSCKTPDLSDKLFNLNGFGPTI